LLLIYPGTEGFQGVEEEVTVMPFHCHVVVYGASVLEWEGHLDARHPGIIIMLSKCARLSENNFWDSQLRDRVPAGRSETILIILTK